MSDQSDPVAPNATTAPDSPQTAPQEAVTAQDAPPRPPTVDDLHAMMEKAEARSRREADEKTQKRAQSAADAFGGAPLIPAPPRAGALDIVSGGVLWVGVAVASVAAVYVMANSDARIWVVIVALLAVATVGVILAGALGLFSAGTRAPTLDERTAPRGSDRELGGAGVLAALGVTEKVLDADPDPRLVAKRDGVVAYANKAYFDLAEKAGVMSASGLPPRIDRLFSEQGADAAKLFQLARAAKSGVRGEEIVHQFIGLEDGGKRRRFNVVVAPIDDAEGYVAWRLRELPDEEQQDVLAAAFADYVRPILAVEKSGQIAWTNAAAREAFGAARGALRRLDDIVLGEIEETLRGLWKIDGKPIEAHVRLRGAAPAHGAFRAFRRGGVGEGFVCVEFTLDETPVEDAAPKVSGDLSEAPFGVAVIEGEFGRNAKIIEANKAFIDAFKGAGKKAALAQCLPEEAIDDIAAEIRGKGAALTPRTIDARVPAEAGAGGFRTYAIYARPVKRRRGSYGVRRTFLFTVDVTDRKRMEEDYAQDQKLKAIGNIAGEVAHDFNNLLQVVLISCEELLHHHPAGDPAYSDLLLIRQNAQRAANLTRQLLAYSRKQTLTTRIESITDLLLDFSRFLDRAVGEKVKLELVNGRDLPAVKVDRLQLETAVMNLVVNARDAMSPNGGKVTIRTERVTGDRLRESPVPGLAPQDCLMIEVADTGPGVPPEIMAKVFDPFFTTKAEGKGTGLGLSTVHGVIGQMDGAITIENAPAGGAVFRIYLPAHAAETIEEDAAQGAQNAQTSAARPVGSAPEDDYSGSGRILVVEDEDGVRLSVLRTVQRAGYDVTVADDGVEALELLEKDQNFDLVITDVMMPEVDGPTLVERARKELGLTTPVIFMSGYAESTVREQLGTLEDAHYIQKPFSRADLGALVREALHSRRAA